MTSRATCAKHFKAAPQQMVQRVKSFPVANPRKMKRPRSSEGMLMGERQRHEDQHHCNSTPGKS